MKRGFTLVELSIVLVVVGLLIGGILAGQSMIQTAKIQSVIREIQQFDIAVTNFQTKYNNLPGDSTAFGCTVADCGNGKITDDGAESYNFDVKIAAFWPQLQQGGFTYQGKNFTSSAPSGSLDSSSNNPNIPSIAGDAKGGGVVALNCNTTKTSSDATIQSTNCWQISNFSTANVTSDLRIGKPTFTAASALAIDTKVDDGLPYSGNVQNWTAFHTGLNGGYADTCTNYGTSYLVGTSGNNCYVNFGLLSQTGQSQ